MVTNLSNEELKNIYWLTHKAKKLTGKNVEVDIISNYLLIDKLMSTEDEGEARKIEKQLLENMKKGGKMDERYSKTIR